jgi:hypothetical protein
LSMELLASLSTQVHARACSVAHALHDARFHCLISVKAMPLSSDESLPILQFESFHGQAPSLPGQRISSLMPQFSNQRLTQSMLPASAAVNCILPPSLLPLPSSWLHCFQFHPPPFGC